MPAPAPTITSAAQAVLGADCQSIRLSVAASASSALSYQWLRNGVEISGATQPELTLNTLNQDRNAQFSVRISAGSASVSSGPVGLDSNAIDGSQLRINSIELGQVMLYPSGDSGLALIQDRAALVKINALASNSTGNCKPTGQLRIEDAQGQVLRSIALTPPSAAIPSTAPTVPSLSTAYSANVPADLMKPGLRLVIAFSGLAAVQRLAPTVVASPAITVVTIPIQIGSTEGAVPPGLADYVLTRSPVAEVRHVIHAPIRSQSVATQPTSRNDWGNALQNLLMEVAEVYRLEGSPARQHYYGVVHQDVAGNFAGQGYLPGNVAVGWDGSGRSTSALLTLIHELGHNFNLSHAPCGSPADADVQYPYANALMGAGSRFIWGWDASALRFIDATDTSRHDLMSYCSGDWLSDYNYANARNWLRSRSANAQALQSSGLQDGMAEQALLLFSGRIDGAGQAQLRPPRAFIGRPDTATAGAGRYLLELQTESATQRHALSLRELDHGQGERHFSVALSHPGPLKSVRLLDPEGRVLQQISDTSAATPSISMRQAASASTASISARRSADGRRLHLRWDAQRWPELDSVIALSPERRQLLGQGLHDGEAELDLGQASESEHLELALRRGLNCEVLRLRLDSAGAATGASP